MKLYLAGMYSQKHELAAAAETLRAAGHIIIARWLSEPHAATTTLDQVPESQLAEYARQDLEDIDAAEVFVFFAVEPTIPTVRGGRHVEFGYALNKIPIIVVGPRENIFHYLSNRVVHVDTVQELIAVIAED